MFRYCTELLPILVGKCFRFSDLMFLCIPRPRHRISVAGSEFVWSQFLKKTKYAPPEQNCLTASLKISLQNELWFGPVVFENQFEEHWQVNRWKRQKSAKKSMSQSLVASSYHVDDIECKRRLAQHFNITAPKHEAKHSDSYAETPKSIDKQCSSFIYPKLKGLCCK